MSNKFRVFIMDMKVVRTSTKYTAGMKMRIDNISFSERRILNIFWVKQISNQQLFKYINQDMRTRWVSACYMLRKGGKRRENIQT